MMASFGKLLVIIGLVIAALGATLWAVGKSGIPVGRLPGDIHLRGENWSFYFPITTCIVLSVVLTIVLNIIARLLR